MSSLQLENLTIAFGHGRKRTVVVEDLNLSVPHGQVVGLVGESGSGKSSVARAIVGLAPVASGRILLDGEDLSALKPRARRLAQMVFQDPYSSLNPRLSVGETIREAIGDSFDARARVAETRRLLDLVALDVAIAGRLPGQLSGGQRQRVAIARALACRPKLLIADEITSALDVSVQGAVLNLVRDLHATLDLTILFISHNLATVRFVSDQVAVMRGGSIVEMLPAEQLMTHAEHPYTRQLLASVPVLGGETEAVRPAGG